MKIERVYLNSFGKFREKELKFSDGLNIIYGANEAGKTTVHTAIRTLLYPLTAKSKDNQEKTCYIPGNEKSAEWSVDFSTDDGKQYTGYVSMGKTKRSCDQKTVDRVLGTELKAEEQSLGELLLQMPEEMFENLSLMRDKTLTQLKNAPLIHRQLSVLQREDEGETPDVLKKLSGAISLIERKNNRMDRLEQTQGELLAKKRELLEKEKEYHLLKEQLASAKEQEERYLKEIADISRLTLEAEQYRQYLKLKSAESLQHKVREEEEALAALQMQLIEYPSELSGEEISRCEALEQQLTLLQQKPLPAVEESLWKKGRSRRICSLVMLILSLVALPFLVVIKWIPIGFSVLCLLLGGFFFRNGRYYQRKAEAQQAQAQQERECEEMTLKLALQKVLSEFGAENVGALREMYQEHGEAKHRVELLQLSLQNNRAMLDSHISEEELTELQKLFAQWIPPVQNREPEELKKHRETLQAKLQESKLEQANLAGKLLNYKGDMELRIRLEEELHTAREDIAHLSRRLEILKKTKEYMEQAKEQLQTGYLPLLNAEILNIVRALGIEDIEQVYVDENLEIAVKEAGQNFLKSGWQLSLGTGDLLYFALRLAVCRLAYAEGESIPLFLDDPFVRLDEERFRAVMDYLNSCGNLQIIYFTCHKRAQECGCSGQMILL